jgi:ZIP family zinc transporter
VYLLTAMPSPNVIGKVISVAAGVMVTVSMLDLYYPIARSWDPIQATLWLFMGGSLCGVLLELPLPEPAALANQLLTRTGPQAPVPLELPAPVSSDKSRPSTSAWRLGLLLAIVLSLHNFPEGLAVGLGSVKSPALGLVLCISM